MRTKHCVVIAFALMHSLCFGQNYSFATDPRASVRSFADELGVLSRTIREQPQLTKDDIPIKGILNHLDFTTMTQPGTFVEAVSRRNVEEEALRTIATSLQNYRQDKQTAAPTSASGTTSLVSKAGSSDLLSLAFDDGALTRTISGTTATINGNLDGVFRAVTGYSPLCVYPCKEIGGKNLQWIDHHLLQPINVSVVTTLAQQGTTAVPSAGQASGTTPIPVSIVAVPTPRAKVTGAVARYQILNKYDPRSPGFHQRWVAAKNAHQFASSLLATNDTILAVRDRVLKSGKPLNRDEMLAAARQGDRELADFFHRYFEETVGVLEKDPGFSAAESLAVQSIAATQQLWETVRQDAAGVLFTLEYSFDHQENQPETHDFKLIYGYAPGTVSGMLSLNGGFSLYGGALPAAANYGRLRYGQLSAEYDRSFTVKSSPNLLSLSLAGYWQYQPDPSILNIPAGTVVSGTTILIPNGTQEFVGTAGSLWVTQAKLTINNKSGINIPIGVKWSNKSDLLTGNKVGAQVGISYDFSSLSNLLGSTSKQLP